MSYLDDEDVKQKLKEDRLLHMKPSSCEGSTMKTWEVDFEFYLNQLRHITPRLARSDQLILNCGREETQNLKAMATQKRVNEEKRESVHRGRKATEDEVKEEKVVAERGERGELKDFVLSKSSVFRHRILGEQ